MTRFRNPGFRRNPGPGTNACRPAPPCIPSPPHTAPQDASACSPDRGPCATHPPKPPRSGNACRQCGRLRRPAGFRPRHGRLCTGALSRRDPHRLGRSGEHRPASSPATPVPSSSRSSLHYARDPRRSVTFCLSQGTSRAFDPPTVGSRRLQASIDRCLASPKQNRRRPPT